jgi:protein SCO1/2
MARSRARWLAPFAAWIALALLSACARQAAAWHGSPYSPPQPSPEFSLRASDGHPVALADFAGSPLLLYFGYTSCPDFCPTTLADLSWVFGELGDQAHRARVLFVTVDPDRDTDERLASYLGKFHPEFIGARAQDDAALQALLDSFAAYAQQDPVEAHDHGGGSGQPITFTHSARVFLIDAAGQMVTNYAFGTPREEILSDLRVAIGSSG